MTPEFKRGDVVRLKSGGPNMVVNKVGPYSADDPQITVWCDWFDHEKARSKDFPPELLEQA